MTTPKWFKLLDRWTDRRPVSALLLICAVCLLAASMTLAWQRDTMLTPTQAWFITGFLAGMVFASLLHVIDLLRKR